MRTIGAVTNLGAERAGQRGRARPSGGRLARTSLSDFIRRKALEAAEADILERRIVTIPAKDWEAFETWANRPPEEVAGLKDLARMPPNVAEVTLTRPYSAALMMRSATSFG